MCRHLVGQFKRTGVGYDFHPMNRPAHFRLQDYDVPESGGVKSRMSETLDSSCSPAQRSFMANADVIQSCHDL
jgi:hypothetical protein